MLCVWIGLLELITVQNPPTVQSFIRLSVVFVLQLVFVLRIVFVLLRCHQMHLFPSRDTGSLLNA